MVLFGRTGNGGRAPYCGLTSATSKVLHSPPPALTRIPKQSQLIRDLFIHATRKHWHKPAAAIRLREASSAYGVGGRRWSDLCLRGAKSRLLFSGR